MYNFVAGDHNIFLDIDWLIIKLLLEVKTSLDSFVPLDDFFLLKCTFLCSLLGNSSFLCGEPLTNTPPTPSPTLLFYSSTAAVPNQLGVKVLRRMGREGG